MKYANLILNYAIEYFRSCLNNRKDLAIEELATIGIKGQAKEYEKEQKWLQSFE